MGSLGLTTESARSAALPADDADAAAREARSRELALAIAELIRRLDISTSGRSRRHRRHQAPRSPCQRRPRPTSPGGGDGSWPRWSSFEACIGRTKDGRRGPLPWAAPIGRWMLERGPRRRPFVDGGTSPVVHLIGRAGTACRASGAECLVKAPRSRFRAHASRAGIRDRIPGRVSPSRGSQTARLGALTLIRRTAAPRCLVTPDFVDRRCRRGPSASRDYRPYPGRQDRQPHRPRRVGWSWSLSHVLTGCRPHDAEYEHGAPVSASMLGSSIAKIGRARRNGHRLCRPGVVRRWRVVGTARSTCSTPTSLCSLTGPSTRARREAPRSTCPGLASTPRRPQIPRPRPRDAPPVQLSESLQLVVQRAGPVDRSSAIRPLLNAGGQVSIAAWVRPSPTSTGYHNVVAHGWRHDPVNHEVALRINSGSYEFTYWNFPDHRAVAAIPASDVGTWVHLCGVFDGSAYHVYRNGALAASTADPVGAPAECRHTVGDWRTRPPARWPRASDARRDRRRPH